MSETSSRGLVKSMLVIGSTRVVNIIISLVRMKVLALLLGPSGVGLLSVFTSLQQMVTTMSGLGMGSSGVREIASVRGEEEALSRVRRVLFAAHLVQGVIAMIAVWVLREQLAIFLLEDANYATEIGLIGIAVLLSLLASSQTALLQGMRRIGDLGRVTVWSSLGSTIAGVAAVWAYGQSGLIWFVIVQPLGAVLTALWYTRKLPRPSSPRPGSREIWTTWRPMAKLGSAFMISTLAGESTLLLVRSIITREFGLEAAGQFSAAWGITMVYIGLLLSAMVADYYPSLAAVIKDRTAANRMINDQAQIALALGGPILLLLIGCAPWAIHLLYSADFDEAVTLLQWQTLGNIFKLASWPLGFAFVAAGRPGVFLVTEFSFNATFLAAIWLGLPVFGLKAAGIGFLLAYVVYFILLHILTIRLQGFVWSASTMKLIGAHVALGCLLLALALLFPFSGAITAVFFALITGLAGGHVVITKVGPDGRLTRPFVRMYAAVGWPIRSSG